LVGYVSLKTKSNTSIGYTNASGVITPWDAQDVVIPPEEEGAVFIATSYQVVYNQTRGECSSADAPCPCDKIAGAATPYGVIVNQCNASSNQCLQSSWCPSAPVTVPFEPAPSELIYGVNSFTIFAKVSAKWPEWGYFVSNYNESIISNGITLGYNLFTVDDVLQAAGTNFSAVQRNGAVILGTAHYDCNFDLDLDLCQPNWTFVRIDAVFNNSNGSNFYFPEYYMLQGADGSLTEARTVWKYYGVNIIWQVNGQGGKFNIVPLLTVIGSGLGLLAVATVIVDVLVLYVHPHRKIYSAFKVEQFEDPTEKKPLLDKT